MRPECAPPLPQVLLVDDEQPLLTAYRRVLGHLKLDLHLASSGSEALALLRRRPIDVVVSDFRMPRLDGRALLQMVHADWPQTVRILITAFRESPEVDQLRREARVFRVLPKPFDPDELCCAISEALIWRRVDLQSPSPRAPSGASPLRISDALFRRAFYAAGQPMMLSDLEGQIVEVNCAFVHAMGGSYRGALRRRGTVQGRWRVAWPDVQRMVVEEGRWTGEVRHTTEDRYAALGLTLLTDDEGRPYAISAVEHDITAAHRLEHESRALEHNVPLAIAKLAEFREPDTGRHLERMRTYCWLLALELSRSPAHAARIDSTYLEAIFAASPLHDVGKVAIPDAILLKPGPLTNEEWDVMRSHPRIGAESLAIGGSEGTVRGWLELGRVIALQHHEKWDGSGYPAGLKGEEIDLAARITALADAYDAITSPRVYKAASSHEDAVRQILDGSGSHFDPQVVAAFLAVAPSFQETMRREAAGRLPQEAAAGSVTSPSAILRRIDRLIRGLHETARIS